MASTPLPEGAIPTEALESMFASYRDGDCKAFGIVRSTVSLVSILSSAFLIKMILRSTKRLTTTQHRILLGMSISDIVSSASQGLYNAATPSEIGYVIWNAHGNVATCTAVGFLTVLGMFASLLYSCSLNLHYLAVVRFGKTDRYIRTKIEPFLHGVPIATALINSILFLAKENLNASLSGSCGWPTYDPPHCIGYENGEVREGFNIPCGRGYDGVPTYWNVFGLCCYFGVPILICVTLGLMYTNVLKQERRTERYEMGTSNRGQSSRDYSRRIFHQALAYSTAYFITWVWYIVVVILRYSGAKIPSWVLYLANFFVPLMGFFNLIVFIYPKVLGARRSHGVEISWCQAIGKVICPSKE